MASNVKFKSIIDFFEVALNVKNLSSAQKMALKVIRAEQLDDSTPIEKQHSYQDKSFANEIEMFKYFSGKDAYVASHYSDASLCWGRRCLEKDTEVLTPSGPVYIQDLKAGDVVYGYNNDGTVSETKVVKSYKQGIQKVTALYNNKRKLVGCTDNHTWLVSRKYKDRKGFYRKALDQRTLSNFNKKDPSIERRFIKIPCGKIYEPHAYAIGALLGDGCSRHSRGSRDIWISSETDLIPNKVKNILAAESLTRGHSSNYNWVIRKNNISCNYYEEWCKDKYAHEKLVDWNVINTWDRESLLQFVAGLLDTDGSVFLSSDTRNLNMGFGCQAKSVVEAFQKAFFKLWQHKLVIYKDEREKYKNGAVYYVNCKSNLYVKRALFELNPYLVTPSKKWKNEYSDFPEQRCENELGVKLGESYEIETFDIEVANDTHLYVLANEGLITHNSGKTTTIGAGLAIYYATQFNYSPYLGTSPHATIPLISASKEQAGEVYAAIKYFFLRSPYLFQKFLDGDVKCFQEEYSEDSIGETAKITGGVIKLNNKVVIKVMAADVGKVRGMACPFVILDECCWFGIEGNDAKNTDQAIYEAITPALSQFQTVEGMAMVLKISSPNGQAGLMYNDFESQKDSDVIHFQMPSWYANPSIAVQYLEKQKKKGISFFNREYGAQYTASEQAYLDPELIDKSIIKGVETIEPQPGFRYVAAMDYATKDDIWAFGIGHKEYVTDPEDKVKKEIVQMDFLIGWRGRSGNELNPDEVLNEIAIYMKKYKVSYCITDQYAFAALRSLAFRKGITLKEFRVSHQSKLKYMYSLQIALNSDIFRMVSHPQAIKHLKDLREKRSHLANKLRIEHANNCNDDFADVIALNVYQFDKSSPIFIGHHFEPEEETIENKDATGKYIGTPTAQQLAEQHGVHGFFDNSKEIEAKKDEDEDENGFWFCF